jgi:hypothetical protein
MGRKTWGGKRAETLGKTTGLVSGSCWHDGDCNFESHDQGGGIIGAGEVFQIQS